MEKLSAKTNAINWFEIPAIDIQRAKKSTKMFWKLK